MRKKRRLFLRVILPILLCILVCAGSILPVFAETEQNTEETQETEEQTDILRTNDTQTEPEQQVSMLEEGETNTVSTAEDGNATSVYAEPVQETETKEEDPVQQEETAKANLADTQESEHSSDEVTVYPALTASNVLGNAWKYGITADTWTQVSGGDAETNFAVKTLDASALAQTGVTASKAVPSKSAESMIRELKGKDSLLIKGIPEKVTAPEDVQKQLRQESGQPMSFVTKSADFIASSVDAMLASVKKTSSSMIGRDSIGDYSVLKDDGQYICKLDLTAEPAGTFYIQVDKYPQMKRAFTQADGVRIKKNTNQTVVFNFTDSAVTLQKYMVTDGGVQTSMDARVDESTSSHDTLARMIFNAPNAASVQMNGAIGGTFLFPNAAVSFASGVGGGWMVCHELALGCEWHFTNGGLPDAFAEETNEPEPEKVEPATVELTARKELSGREVQDGEFSFIMTAEDNAPMPDNAKNGELTVTNTGNLVSFGTVTYSDPGIYRYTVREEKGTKNGVTYDNSTKTIIVNVEKGTDGSLHANVGGNNQIFRNTYTPKETSVNITATKDLEGRDINDGEFSFLLESKDHAPMPEEAKDGKLIVSNSGSDIDFGSVIFTKAGTYKYQMTEEKGEEAGVTYDDSVKEFAITVTDDHSGSLHAQITGDELVFHNTFVNDTITISGTETWNVPANHTIPKLRIRLMRNGKRFMTKTVSPEETSFAFENVAKYDEKGKEYTYTVEEDNELTEYENSRDGNNFTHTLSVTENPGNNSNTEQKNHEQENSDATQIEKIKPDDTKDKETADKTEQTDTDKTSSVHETKATENTKDSANQTVKDISDTSATKGNLTQAKGNDSAYKSDNADKNGNQIPDGVQTGDHSQALIDFLLCAASAVALFLLVYVAKRREKRQ